MKTLLSVALLVCLSAVVSAAPADSVRWCVKSDIEFRKCRDLKARVPAICCVKKENTLACIVAIKEGNADAITLDGGDIYTAGLKNYNLQPIIAEDYGTSSETCYYAVAVVKKSSVFTFSNLKGKKSCHTGLGKSAGWVIPIGTLLSMDLIEWLGTDDRPIEAVVKDYFGGSCAPGADKNSKLCQLCAGDCSRSHTEPYYDYNGAFRCLAEDAGEVAFVKHLTVPDAEKSKYELLCKDNTRKAIDDYKSCHLAKVPAHAVVTRKDPVMADLIWRIIHSVDNFDLFSSENYNPAKNLMFKDSTVKLVQIPPNTDSFLYLGAEYMSIIRSIRREHAPATASKAIKWCTVSSFETEKCDTWSINSIGPDGTSIECQDAPTVDECLKKIMRKEADAMAVDGGEVYTAGKCGLIPVMVEQYEDKCDMPGADASSYFAVAVVKKNSKVTWNNLRGKKSCHTGVGRTAGWNIPMGHIHNMTNDCNFTNFFPSGCAPGSNPSSSFCKECIGSGKEVDDGSKCKASADERYYGYAGAFRCLVEGKGDVAFIKHGIVEQNTGKISPAWASMNADDFRLICPNNNNPVKVSDYAACHLALVPAHAVVTRPEMRDEVVRILKEQQSRFGSFVKDPPFRMFESINGKNLLFKDSTKCLQEVPAGTSYDKFLGVEYINAIDSLRECTESTSALEKSCTFHSCQRKN